MMKSFSHTHSKSLQRHERSQDVPHSKRGHNSIFLHCNIDLNKLKEVLWSLGKCIIVYKDLYRSMFVQ